MKILESFSTKDGRCQYVLSEINLDGQRSYGLMLVDRDTVKDFAPFKTILEAQDALNTALIACLDHGFQFLRAGAA